MLCDASISASETVLQVDRRTLDANANAGANVTAMQMLAMQCQYKCRCKCYSYATIGYGARFRPVLQITMYSVVCGGYASTKLCF